MTSEPRKIDVLLAVREPAPWLRETLVSLTEQTFHDFRLVLVIHGPDRNTSSLVKRYFPDTLILHCSEELTLPEVRAFGLSNCSAPLVALTDADDVSHPDRLAKQSAYLNANQNVAMVSSPMGIIDAESNPLHGQRGARSSRFFLYRLLLRNVIGQSSVMMRREVAEQCGSYRNQTIGVEDYDLWLRIGARSRIEVLPEICVSYRVHISQTSRNTKITSESLQKVRESRVVLARTLRVPKYMVYFMHQVWARSQQSS